MADLFDRYPDSPGTAPVDTSVDAGARIAGKANIIREQCLTIFSRGGFTADEVAARIGLHWQSVRPRITELKTTGHIIDTGTRRPSAMGSPQAVFCLTPVGTTPTTTRRIENGWKTYRR